MKLENPFPEYGYFGPEYFCDREQETEELISALVNGSNVTLMGYSSRHTQVPLTFASDYRDCSIFMK